MRLAVSSTPSAEITSADKRRPIEAMCEKFGFMLPRFGRSAQNEPPHGGRIGHYSHRQGGCGVRSAIAEV